MSISKITSNSIEPNVSLTGAFTADAINATGTGANIMPVGTTAQRPASSAIGMIRFNTDLNALENFNADGWFRVKDAIPTLTAVDGNVFAGAASTLTLTGTDFGSDAGTVRFTSGATVENVTVTPASQTSATVTVPAAIFNLSASTVVGVQFINFAGGVSGSINKTVIALPTGGTITTSDGFRIHTFTSSASFVVPSGLTLSGVEYLVIAGGGGGGADDAGGGGAGGYRCSVVGESSGGGASAEARLTLTPSTYTVTVGAGGAGSVDAVNGQFSGSNSVLSTITSIGGGAGGNNEAGGFTGLSGGSGGGGHNSSASVGGSGTSGQGFAGGQGNQGGINGAGGGGAAQTGGQGNIRNSFGGNGVASAITGTSVTRGGGGGGGSRIFDFPLGGTGGGGDGSFLNSAIPNGGSGSPGGANTGGGGGGGQGSGSGVTRNGGNGGSGIVIVRYTL